MITFNGLRLNELRDFIWILLYYRDMRSDDAPAPRPTIGGVYGPDWDPEAALLATVQDKQILGTSYDDQSREVLDQAGPAAARSIVNIALYSTNEPTKLKAAQYILDRQLGRTGEEKQASSNQDPLTALLGQIVQQVEDHANSTSPSS